MKVYFVNILYKGNRCGDLGKWFKTKKKAHEEFSKWLQKDRRSTKDYKMELLYIDIIPALINNKWRSK